MSLATEWADAISAFDAYLRTTDLAEATIDTHLYHVTRCAESAPGGPWGLTAAELGRWLEARGWGTVTRRKVVGSLRLFYAWAISHGRCEWAPTSGIPTSARHRPGPPPRPFSKAWAGEISEWQTWGMAAGLAKGTLKVRRCHMMLLAEVSADPWKVTTTQLVEWLANPEWSPCARKSARSSLRCFYSWGAKVGKIETSPAAALDPVRIPRSLPRPAPDDVILEALAGVGEDRLRIALLLGALAGLRAGEIAGMHCTSIGDADLLVIGKGGHHRRVSIHPDLGLELRAELGRRRDGGHGSGFPDGASDVGWLFPTSFGRGSASPVVGAGGHVTSGHMTKIIARALPGGWTAHTLRHRFATTVYAVTPDLLRLQQMLGHARSETTSRYAAVPSAGDAAIVAQIGL